MKKKVSIITTTYNSLEFLSENIDSIENQNYSNTEHIIVNDGSDDGTHKFLSSLNNKNIKYINIPRSGRGKALNIGIENASGDFIAILDADDVSSNKRISEQVMFFQEHGDCDVLCTEYSTSSNSLNKDENNDDDFIKLFAKDFLLRNPICHSSVMMRREIFDGHEAYDQSLERLLDFDLWVRLLKREDLNFYKINRLHVFKRIHHGQYFETRNRISYLKGIFQLKLDLVDHFNFSLSKRILIMLSFIYGMLPRAIRFFWMGKE